MAYVDFIMKNHLATKRDYVGRVNEADKATCSEVAIKFGKDYWDGERRFGYGGYKYDGRWRQIAEDMVRHYNLKPGARILDVGCGKGFLLYEFTQIIKDVEVVGLDISQYAIENAKAEVKPFLVQGSAVSLPFKDKSFDYIVSINALHNLYIQDLFAALKEIERVGRGAKHVIIETYRNEREKANLLYWQLTCRAFHTPQEWEWIFKQAGYSGDYSYIAFE
jgi:ubiquinone/menaquinone biosynthesis C-methylase UbiE